jgi:hypothetical protein
VGDNDSFQEYHNLKKLANCGDDYSGSRFQTKNRIYKLPKFYLTELITPIFDNATKPAQYLLVVCVLCGSILKNAGTIGASHSANAP